MEERDRRPHGRYEEYQFSQIDRFPIWEPRGASPSLYGQTHDHLGYRDHLQNERFGGQQHEERYDGHRYYQDREFREGLSRPSYVDEEFYE
jgi:hypothetical protein